MATQYQKRGVSSCRGRSRASCSVSPTSRAFGTPDTRGSCSATFFCRGGKRCEVKRRDVGGNTSDSKRIGAGKVEVESDKPARRRRWLVHVHQRAFKSKKAAHHSYSHDTRTPQEDKSTTNCSKRKKTNLRASNMPIRHTSRSTRVNMQERDFVARIASRECHATGSSDGC